MSLEDIHDAELIFVVGQNPGTNHPRMLSALKECKDKGGKVVAVNPLPEAGLFNFKDPQTLSGVVGGGTPLADEYLQIKVGGDLALFQALGHLLLAGRGTKPGDRRRPFLHRGADGRLRRVPGRPPGAGLGRDGAGHRPAPEADRGRGRDAGGVQGHASSAGHSA